MNKLKYYAEVSTKYGKYLITNKNVSKRHHKIKPINLHNSYVYCTLFRSFDRKGNECLHIWFLQQFAKNILNKLLIVQKEKNTY